MKHLTILFLLFIPVMLRAQDDSLIPSSPVHLGLGGGLDYGGLGVRATFLPVKTVGVFIGAGYNLNSLACNAGAQYIFPAGRHQVYLTGMYGYNAVIVVAGDYKANATYYGFTGGGGFQLNMKRKGFWNFELLVPARGSNFKKDLDTLQELGVKIKEPMPFTISIGYHFRIG